MLQPHQQRVVQEKAELDERITRLSQFINENSAFPTIGAFEQNLMKEQFSLMSELSYVLGLRIALWTDTST